MIFYVFFETDGDYGKYRRSYGFRTLAARSAWITEELRLLALRTDEFLSDLEEWESEDGTWSHLSIIE
jgi:hypothetical protein